MSRINKIISRNPFITIGAAIGCALAIFLILATILYVAHESKDSRVSTCDAIYKLRDTTRAVLEDASNSDPRPANKAFYQRNINKLNKVKCDA